MIEQIGDLWTVEAEARVVTTNGFVKKDGGAVMGAGVALQAADRWPWVPALLGASIQELGNHVAYLGLFGDTDLVAFPVKTHWREKASPTLIVRSAVELVELTDTMGWERVALPRPGCGNGRLRWPAVRPLIADVLDHRFVVVQD